MLAGGWLPEILCRSGLWLMLAQYSHECMARLVSEAASSSAEKPLPALAGWVSRRVEWTARECKKLVAGGHQVLPA